MWLWTVSLAIAQTLPNGSLDADIPISVPNNLSATDWTYDGTDVAQVGAPIDCFNVLVLDSTDGEQFARALDFYDPLSGIYREQGLSAQVTNLVVGIPYMVRFEAGIVRHFGQSSGHWSVTFAGITVDAPDLTIPAADPEQGPWVAQEVGPFTALTTEDTLAFIAHTNEDGVANSANLPAVGCNYLGNALAVDLLIDGISVVGDSDLDTLYDDEEALYGTDPTLPDTDGDGLDDATEVRVTGTNPLAADTDEDGLDDATEVGSASDPVNPDTDGDTLLDGQEAELGTNPADPDSDSDGLQDPDELGIGTDPTNPDMDGDGLSDGTEVLQGYDPLDPKDPFFPGTVTVDTTPPTVYTTPPTTTPDLPDRTPPETDDKPPESVGCGCNGASPSAPGWGWLLAAALGLGHRLRVRRLAPFPRRS